MTDPLEDARAEAQMLQAVDELAEKTAEVERLAAELEALRAEQADQRLRAQAELQNVQARHRRDAPRLREDGKADALAPLFGVVDDLSRALEHARSTDAAEAIVAGLEGVLANAEAALAKLGVEAIPVVGEPFDTHLHEALTQLPAPDGEASGTVLQEFRRGYRLGERVLRHSQVVVAA